MNVWLVSPAWRRFAVTRLALTQRARLAGDLAARGIQASNVIVGDDLNLETAQKLGFHIVEQNNDYLGRKFNDGIEYAAEHGADFIVTIGSDDWVHADLFDRLPLDTPEPPEPTRENPVVVGTVSPEIITGRQILLVDMLKGRAKACTATGRYGVIPWIIPRKALEKSRFRPIQDKLERGIDGALIAGLGLRPHWVFVDPDPVCRVDFKSDVNLNTYAKIAGAIGGEEIADPWALLASRYPEDLVDLAYQTHLEIA